VSIIPAIKISARIKSINRNKASDVRFSINVLFLMPICREGEMPALLPPCGRPCLQIQSQLLLPTVFLTTKTQLLGGAVYQLRKLAVETTELPAVGIWRQIIQSELFCVSQKRSRWSSQLYLQQISEKLCGKTYGNYKLRFLLRMSNTRRMQLNIHKTFGGCLLRGFHDVWQKVVYMACWKRKMICDATFSKFIGR